MPIDDDALEALLLKAQGNDAAAIAQLYQHALPWMTQFVQGRLKSSPYLNREPEDVVQEAWAKVLPNISRIVDGPRPAPRFVAFVSTALNNILIDAIRRKETSLRELESDVLQHSTAEGSTPSRLVAETQAFFFLAEAVSQLTQDQRDLIRMRYDQGMTHRQIADHLNAHNPPPPVTEVAVRLRLNRIHEKLRTQMGASTLYFLPPAPAPAPKPKTS